jgi:serine/threonine protein kinase
MDGNEALMTEQGRQLQPLRYELVKILAEGSYGKVILARDTLSQEHLAFKVFTMEVHEGEEGEGEDDEDDKHMKARRKYTEDEEEIKECSQMA